MRLIGLVLVGLVGGLVACVPPPVYRVQRTARVPRPAAPLRTGEPLAGPIELSVGASSIGDVTKPELVDHDASIEVAREQMRAELRIRLGERGELAPIYEQAVGMMQSLDATQAPVEQGLPSGLGLATRYSFDAGSGLSFGLGLEAIAWSIPYVEYRTCVAYCEENDAPIQQMNHGSETVGTLGLAFVPTYRHGNLALFGGAYARRHPTIVRKGTEQFVSDYDEDVDGGVYNVLVHAGIEYRLPVVSLMATVQQDLTADPVAYGPSFGLAIALRVPDRKRTQRAPEPAAPPAPIVQGGAPGDTAETGFEARDAELPDDPW